MVFPKQIFILAAVVNAIELPDCPSGVQYFPQNLPMHCKLPKDFQEKLATMPTVPPFPNSYFQTLPPGNLQAIPVAAAPGVPMGLPMPVPAPNIPVIVMPIYKPTKETKKNKKRDRHTKNRPFDFGSNSDKDSSDQEDADNNSDKDFKRPRRIEDYYDKKHKNSREYYEPDRLPKKSKKKEFYRRSGPIMVDNDDELTPVLQYVSKDGYVIFEKELTESEEDSWLDLGMADKGNDGDVTTVGPTLSTEKVGGRIFRMLAFQKAKEKKKTS